MTILDPNVAVRASSAALTCAAGTRLIEPIVFAAMGLAILLVPRRTLLDIHYYLGPWPSRLLGPRVTVLYLRALGLGCVAVAVYLLITY